MLGHRDVWLSFEFTYLSNLTIARNPARSVWLSFEFTYLSNERTSLIKRTCVWLSFEFTYLSNQRVGHNDPKTSLIILWIYISLKHGTYAGKLVESLIILWIYISLKPLLDFVDRRVGLIILWIYISLKRGFNKSPLFFVWLSFEFTYLSNHGVVAEKPPMVWLSFEFTYLSNITPNSPDPDRFDYPLNLHISQTCLPWYHLLKSLIILWIYISLKPLNGAEASCASLIILWIYISLKPLTMSRLLCVCLIILWIYISLKRGRLLVHCRSGLIILWIYISLKHSIVSTNGAFVWLSFEFTYLSNPGGLRRRVWQFDYPLNLHISQTQRCLLHRTRQFDYPLNLHISQTRKSAFQGDWSLIILWIYISLKPGHWQGYQCTGLIILWIYISLKHGVRLNVW